MEWTSGARAVEALVPRDPRLRPREVLFPPRPDAVGDVCSR